MRTGDADMTINYQLRIPRSGRQVPLDRPLVVGILNINHDSFCDDGTLDPEEAGVRIRQMIADGADAIDIGAESARTNRQAISVAEEIDRLLPVIDMFRMGVGVDAGERLDDKQLWPPLLSVNTWRPEVVAAILPVAGDLLNDMGSMATERNARLAATHGAALLIMHNVGSPKVANKGQCYTDVLQALETFFDAKLAAAKAAGVSHNALVLDPGIDFAKQPDDNLRILAGLDRLRRFPHPVLMPISRKSVIGAALDVADPKNRDAGTIACLSASMLRHPALLFRVHNVRAAALSVRMLMPLVGHG